MLVKVPSTDVMQGAALEYDLYGLGGELLYPAGTLLRQDIRAQLTRKSLYRQDQDLPCQTDCFDHEGYVFRFIAGVSAAERAHQEAEDQSAPLLSAELSQSCVRSIAYFWERLHKGATPDIALCEVARDQLIAEVTNQVDQIQYLSQVRVRDEFTYSHILDVTALSIALAIKAGFSPSEVREIALAAILHDLGKLMIPRQIMFKPSRLTEKEFQVMKLHPELGYNMIVDTLGLPESVARPALEHQEMYGGGGYPQGLQGDEIHPYSHVVKIADVYDALTSKRPYKESIPSAKAIRIMLSEGDKSFHPVYLAHFVSMANYYDPENMVGALMTAQRAAS